MPGMPVTIGCAVMVTPGVTGAPDMGLIVTIFPPVILAGGLPLAVSGSLCQMVNSLTGVPYPLLIGTPTSAGVTVGGRGLVRLGDRIPSPPGILLVLGPPAAPYVLDRWPP